MPQNVKLLADPTYFELREFIAGHADGRSASGDVVIFYFSGHGTALGRGEFALCAKDSRRMGSDGPVDPMSVVRFSDVVMTLRGRNIHPLFIIDACFSGLAALDSTLSPNSFQDSMQEELTNQLGQSYGLLCACSSDQTAKDGADGGAFTTLIGRVCGGGLRGSSSRRTRYITLTQLISMLQEEAKKCGLDPMPRFHRAQSFPDIPMCQNVKYSPLQYSFTKYMANLLVCLHKVGPPYEMQISDFSNVSQGAYGNHSKMGRKPWSLLEYGRTRKSRRLSAKGIKFVEGKCGIPATVQQKGDESEEYEAVPGCKQIKITDLIR